MNQILVPTDFSDTAQKAFLYALHLAQKSGATIYLIHVYSALNSPFIETVEVRDGYNLELEKDLMAQLHKLRDSVQGAYQDVEIKAVLGQSPLVTTILEFSERNDIDLIVMGTQGASGLQKVIMGTVASRILEKATKPLLLVPEQFEWRAPTSIIIASNYYDGDTDAVRMSNHIAQLYNGAVTIVHIADGCQHEEDTQERFDAYVKQLTSGTDHTRFRSIRLESDEVLDSLEALQEQIPYDLLVMVSRRRVMLDYIFMESITRHMAFLILHPLLVIPALEDEG